MSLKSHYQYHGLSLCRQNRIITDSAPESFKDWARLKRNVLHFVYNIFKWIEMNLSLKQFHWRFYVSNGQYKHKSLVQAVFCRPTSVQKNVIWKLYYISARKRISFHGITTLTLSYAIRLMKFTTYVILRIDLFKLMVSQSIISFVLLAWYIHISWKLDTYLIAAVWLPFSLSGTRPAMTLESLFKEENLIKVIDGPSYCWLVLNKEILQTTWHKVAQHVCDFGCVTSALGLVPCPGLTLAPYIDKNLTVAR